ncbi:Protein tyrosine/serine phosphatase [Rhodovulum sp. ES.010]|uniref:phosphatase domain-containing protein n=1 Tax=Rhodovulum sp. ES.010 TaxID=1882821 RepID=UPI00092B0B9A|nr:tyrosine-protein phosphatase [Rhodovulum sp. ES.010]SIO31898.1 Protein tyrosine/serine phosphatase [Rhodovulum sp. ES.010]
MFDQIKTRFEAFDRRVRDAFGGDFTTPGGRRAAFWHFQVMDHAALRTLWTNLHEIAPGAWRSNQPDPRRLHRYRDMGIRTVLSLRRSGTSSHHLFEEEACRDLGLTLVNQRMHARQLLPAGQLLALLDLFERIEKPFVMHCKSGSDRAGFASALYLIHMEGASVAEARRMLHWRYIHFRNSASGILDAMLDAFEADIRAEPMPLRDWIATRYDPEAITAAFRAGRGR